ncbi:hypothetical protein ILYODFUR_007478 [Ilyodon furcidens]|uniref:Uncharacterized protein n=1 Tax=Ilyodon furcidens TaxID=33524 RepID=A0ABV0UI85_9TELE
MVPVVLFMQQFDENRYLMGHINMAQRMWVRTGRVQLTGPELKGRRGSGFEDLSPSDLSVLEREGGPYKQRNVRVVELPPPPFKYRNSHKTLCKRSGKNTHNHCLCP